MFRTFTRTWWKNNPRWPNGLEPCPGDKTYLEDYDTEEEAQDFCREYNKNHNPGRLSCKAEYEES